jgi:L,D-transpeptidase catalytic domain
MSHLGRIYPGRGIRPRIAVAHGKMPAVNLRRGTLAAVAIGSAGLVLAPGVALAQGVGPLDPGGSGGPPPQEPQGPRPSKVGVDVRGLDGNSIKVGKRVTIVGNLRPFEPGEKVKLLLIRKGDVVDRATKRTRRIPGKDAARATMRTEKLIKPGRYTARVVHQQSSELRADSASSGNFKPRYPSLGGRDNGNIVALFHNLLQKEGYGNAPGGSKFNEATARAVLAFRKVNRMSRNSQADSGVFKKLASGKGSFKLAHPDAGKHVEVDISRQVMVLAAKGKPQYTYHISSGAPGTPSDRGQYRFYRKDAGFNSIGMYYSAYYNGGEATHGYKSVPTYPASHGCLRNPIPDSIFIYNWIDLGDPIWVYD